MSSLSGTLDCIDVEYVRTTRYRRQGQTESHRAPRYRVRYQLEGQPAREAMVVPHAALLIVWRIRSSKSGDFVQVRLSPNERNIIGWNNQTVEALWNDLLGA